MSLFTASTIAGIACTLFVTGVSVLLFLHLKKLQEESQSRSNKRQQTIHSELGKLRGEVEDLRNRLEDAERNAASIPAPRNPLAGLNQAHRTQALRLMRKGESADKIAATLGVPRGEIDLLIKVQQMLALDRQPEPPASPNRRFTIPEAARRGL